MPPDLSWKVGLIGYGLSGRIFHAPLIDATPDLALSAIVTSDPSRVRAASRDFPTARITGDVDELLVGGERVDLVVVAASNDAHLPLAMRCIEAGVAVVVDKPLATSVEAASQLVTFAESAGVLLSVFQNRRWDNDFLTLTRLLDDGRLGQVHRFESRFERWAPQLRENSWRERADPIYGGGLLFDLGAHLIDQATVLFGEVTAVYAELDCRRAGSAVDDDVFVTLTHRDGVRSHLWMSAVAPELGPRFRVLGDRAGYTRYGLDPQESQLAAGLRPRSPEWGKDGPQHDGILGAGDVAETVPTARGAYERFYAAIAQTLRVGGEPPVDPRDAIAVLNVIEAARRSAATRRVVEMIR